MAVVFASYPPNYFEAPLPGPVPRHPARDTWRPSTVFVRAVGERAAVFEAIESQDAAAAGRAMACHIDSALWAPGQARERRRSTHCSGWADALPLTVWARKARSWPDVSTVSAAWPGQ